MIYSLVRRRDSAGDLFFDEVEIFAPERRNDAGGECHTLPITGDA
jgi:hypothetical protein